MKNPLSELYNKLKRVSVKTDKGLFIDYCQKLINLKEKGELIEEDAAYWIVQGIGGEDLSSEHEFYMIFDIAADTEIPREASPVKEIAKLKNISIDEAKKEQWQKLVNAVSKASRAMDGKSGIL